MLKTIDPDDVHVKRNLSKSKIVSNLVRLA